MGSITDVFVQKLHCQTECGAPLPQLTQGLLVVATVGIPGVAME